MAIVFPGGLDNFTNPTPADNLSTPAVLHTDQHSDLNDAVEALEAKVGINSSLVTGSFDFRVSQLESSSGHSPVTLGTANGLSLSGQAISMSLASATATGTLSATDWNTFNNKQNALGFTAVPNTRLISTTSPLAGGGDLSIDRTLSMPQASGTQSGYLSGADWVIFNSKQSALSFPLAANLGGSGISNSGTFTYHSNTVIVGGGTLNLGNFSVVAPASGTMALLGIDNAFTRQNTFTTPSGTAVVVSSDLGLTGIPWQHYGVMQVKRSTGVGAGLELGYGTRGASDPGTENYGQITAIHSSATLARLALGVQGITVPSIVIAASGAVEIGWSSTDTINTNSLITTGVKLHGRLAFGIDVITTSTTMSIYETSYVSGGSTGDLTLQSRYLSGGGTQSKAVSMIHGTSVSDPDAYFSSRLEGCIVGPHTIDAVKIAAPLARLHIREITSTMNAVKEVMRLDANVSAASTGTSNGFGVSYGLYAETATNGTVQQQGLVATSWIDSTNASRKAKMSFSAYDTAVRLGIEIEANGSVVKLGFFGVATVIRPTALTTQLTTITFTAPTPDYAIQNLTNVTPFGFVTQDEGNTVLSVIANLQTRVGELETKLQALGLLT